MESDPPTSAHLTSVNTAANATASTLTTADFDLEEQARARARRIVEVEYVDGGTDALCWLDDAERSVDLAARDLAAYAPARMTADLLGSHIRIQAGLLCSRIWRESRGFLAGEDD